MLRGRDKQKERAEGGNRPQYSSLDSGDKTHKSSLIVCNKKKKKSYLQVTYPYVKMRKPYVKMINHNQGVCP